MTYYYRLDSLRALAVSLVLYTHYLPEANWLFGIYWGEYGVRLFFVLSGFLITKLLLIDLAKQRNSSGEVHLMDSILRFYARRILRLTPILFLTVSIAAVLNFPESRETYFWHITYLSNIKMALTGSWLGDHAPLWSLSVEEQFYLIWPFAIILIPRKIIVYVILICIPIVWMYRSVFKIYFSSDIAMWVLLPNSMDALLIGGLVGLMHLKHNLKHSNFWFILLTISSFVYCLIEKSGWIVWPYLLSIPELGTTLVCVVFSWLILYSCDVKPRISDCVLGSGVLMYLGKISYGIYLMHTFVFSGLLLVLNKSQVEIFNPFVIGVLATITTVLLASISWRYLESPIIKWRNRMPILK